MCVCVCEGFESEFVPHCDGTTGICSLTYCRVNSRHNPDLQNFGVSKIYFLFGFLKNLVLLFCKAAIDQK